MAFKSVLSNYTKVLLIFLELLNIYKQHSLQDNSNLFQCQQILVLLLP